MKIKIVSVGKLKENFFADAVNEYCKRLNRFCKVELIEAEECFFKGIPNAKEVEKVKSIEGKAILPFLEGFVIGLDVLGEQVSSEEFANLIDSTKLFSSTITFVIGGSFGLSEEVKSKFDKKMSFGKMTFPHQLMRVVLCEQIYRAFMISCGSAYHK